jgi:hypothetical protein
LTSANSLSPSDDLSVAEQKHKVTAAVREWDEALTTFKAAARTGIHPAG